ncbi:hypothetical protein [Sorangium sp. So ce1078]|uniref:hypothetical protein n=1 Tax=Sorangium sp. So ce1078 TaxID=3133329 RepID=UPI003F6113F1
MMLTLYPEPEKYFQRFDLHESLVLRFVCAHEHSKVDLVLDYAGDAVELVGSGKWKKGDPVPPRDLRRIVFSGVEGIVHRGVQTSAVVTPSEYVLARTTGPIVLEAVSFAKDHNRYRVELGMGLSGSHGFIFESMMVDQRLGRARQVGAQRWVYRDLLTDEEFDFYEPFDRVV